MNQIPLLLLSDAPDQNSGLARVSRDLATMMCTNPKFRVATLGFHGSGSNRLPFMQYQMAANEFGELSLPNAWNDFSRGQNGIVLTCWDISRLLWLARPEYLQDEDLKQKIINLRQHARIWSYFPIDSTGPNDRLTAMARETMLGLTRILTTSPWAESVIRRTLGEEASEQRGLTWMPHAINTDTFNSKYKYMADKYDDQANRLPPKIGIVATNQIRKEWGLSAQICAMLKDFVPGIRFWWHVDVDTRHFSIPALLEDYDLKDVTEVTHSPISDKEMAARYRSCTLTLQPTLGEGFGYSIFESLACGVPVIHGAYASGASLMQTCGLDSYLVPPVAWRIETEFNCVRPVYRPEDWARKVMEVLNMDHGNLSEEVEHLAVKNLYHCWRRWFEDGIAS